MKRTVTRHYGCERGWRGDESVLNALFMRRTVATNDFKARNFGQWYKFSFGTVDQGKMKKLEDGCEDPV